MQPEHPVDLQKLQAARAELRSGFTSGRTLAAHARLALLNQIESLVVENHNEICDALRADLGRPEEDTLIAELSVVVEEVHAARKNLRSWMARENHLMPLVLFPSRGYTTFVPFGVALIIGPWNYPIQLLLAPLVSAIAAGNCAFLKPSELTPACSALLCRLIPRYFPQDVVQIMGGGVELSTRLLELQWDFIFFTGSTQVGRIVATAAARHLTPTVLELGGKSPCLVDSTAQLDVTARRILWGKTLNAGQTCVAPDYILTPRSNAEPLVAALRKVLGEFFPDGFHRSKTYCGIVNQAHFQRLSNLADQHKEQLKIGGRCDSEHRLIEPSIYVLDINQTPTAALMQEEIFGPLLPIVTYENTQQAIDFINQHDHPLALYVFSADASLVETIESGTQSGSLVVNDTVIHLATSQLPFGGVGASGYGNYHGVYGFRAFSHRRSVLKRPFWLDLPIRYRPFAAWKLFILRKLLGFRNKPKLPSPAR